MEIKENVDYVFVPARNENETYCIQILTGDYSGVRFKYGEVKFEEDAEKEEAFLNFEYEILDKANQENLIENVDFKNHLGDILVNIIEKNATKHLQEQEEEELEYIEE